MVIAAMVAIAVMAAPVIMVDLHMAARVMPPDLLRRLAAGVAAGAVVAGAVVVAADVGGTDGDHECEFC
jgi:hypothetical protein